MVRNHDEMGQDSLTTRESDTSAQEDEEEELADEDQDEDQEESDYYRMDRLLGLRERDELPGLSPTLLFERPDLTDWNPSINKDEFTARLKHFLKTEALAMPPLGPPLIDFLFNTAVDAQRHVVAWEAIVKKVKGREFDKTRGYLQQELNRYTKIRSLLLMKKKEKTPSWVFDWSHCWVEAFEEIQEHIEAQLRGAIVILDTLSPWRKSGRIEVESHVLWMEKRAIREHIANTAMARKITVILPAFAYAAKLVLPKPGKDTAGYSAMIKSRVSRAGRLDKLGVNLQLMIAGISSTGMRSGSNPRS
jgi:hypothetical protein